MKLLSLVIVLLLMPVCAAAQTSLSFLHPHDVVVFQGDSITDGGRWRTGSDFNHIMGQDYAYMLAGKIGAEYPERDLTFVNRGISGDRVLDLAARWQSDVIDLRPSLLSILVGINDTFAAGPKAESVEEFDRTSNRLLSQTLSALPGIRIVLGDPFLLPVAKHAANYAAELEQVKERQRVVHKLAAKYHLPEISYQDVFDGACRRAPADHWSWDGVHPTYAGHWLMMQAWLQTVSVFWPNG